MKQLFIYLVLRYLKFFAKLAVFINKPTIIGIAGSVGKSSTRDILYAILKDHFSTKMTFGNSETGIPLSVLGIKPQGYTVSNWIKMILLCPFHVFYLRGTKYLIVEMGIDGPQRPKNMEYLLEIIVPTIAISLNISATHTMQFEEGLRKDVPKDDKEKEQFLLDAIAKEDTKIITRSHCNTGIFNNDDLFIKKYVELFKKSSHDTTLLSFGKTSTADISLARYHVDITGTKFVLKMPSTRKNISFLFRNRLLPEAYWELLAAATLCAKQLGLTDEQIASSLEKNISLPKGRSSILEGIHNALIIDSSYNASKSAVLSFLDLALKLKKKSGNKLIFLFGDMRELGTQAKREHEAVAEKITSTVDYLYCVGPLTKQYVLPYIHNKKSIVKEAIWFENALKAGDYIKEYLVNNTIILVKGSQNTLFLEEGIKKFLKNKADEKLLCRQEPYWMKIKKDYFSL